MQHDIKTLQNNLEKANDIKLKNKIGEKKSQEYKDRIKREIAYKAEFMAFLIFDYEEVKIGTKEKEQTQ